MASFFASKRLFIFFLLGLPLLLGGCPLSLPRWQAELWAPTAAHWQARLPHDGSPANLADWWKQFDDSTLSLLLDTAHASHPNLQRALAAIHEARAALLGRQSDRLPRLDGSITSQRIGDRSDTRPGQVNSAYPEALNTNSGLDAKWELDLFGGLRQAEEAAAARLNSRQQAWHDARISLSAEVAGKYVNYRACRQLWQLTRQEADSRQESVRSITIAVTAGLQAAVELHQAQARLHDALAAATAQQTQCELTVKSLVTLSGLQEPTLRALLDQETATLPQPAAFAVQTVPIDLLNQRPDLAALEQEVLATIADLGQADANRLPRLTLSGTIAINALQTAQTVVATQPWTLGPMLALPLLDGGGREARVAEAQARYEQAVARYQGAVRSAVEEVESALVNLESARLRLTDAEAIRQHQQSLLHSDETLFQQGGMSQLALEEVRRGLLAAQKGETLLQRERIQAWITLYKALGGGWQPQTAVSPSPSSFRPRDES
ncbi:MAG: efflux transporter outer membrane subunit [Magnetococcales bacterium]|nr:efflux transporter outer membrane subunit [Magnetococcales bacterium]